MTDALPENRATLSAIIALLLVLFLCANLPWQLDDYDQAKQAYTSFEMVKEGHWFFQDTPHERIATKPPLVGWVSAGIYEVTRSWNVAWRLPSIVAAIALSILLFRAGAVYGAAAGLLAVSAFGFNLLTPRLASLVRTDMPLALAVASIGLSIWHKVRERKGWSRGDRIWLFGLLTAAMLIKGPIVYAFLLPGMLCLVWSTRNIKSDLRGCGWWPWLASLGIFLLWVIAGCRFVPGFYDQVVGHEFLGRFGETAHRPQPFYFYVPHLLHKFAPWSLLMIVLAIIDVRALSQLDGLKPSGLKKMLVQKIAPETLFLVGWALGGVIVMSLIPSKRVDRIFPVIPALCLLLAGQVAQRPPSFRRWAVGTTILSILFTAGYGGFKVFTGYRDNRDALVKFGNAARAEIAKHGWRFEVVNASDEGLLVYSDKLHFVKQEPAMELWNGGLVDALIVPQKNAADFPDATPLLKSAERKDSRGDYVLITR